MVDERLIFQEELRENMLSSRQQQCLEQFLRMLSNPRTNESISFML
jgi:hypothetical protein